MQPSALHRFRFACAKRLLTLIMQQSGVLRMSSMPCAASKRASSTHVSRLTVSVLGALQRVEAWEVSSIWQRQLVQEGPKSSASFTMYEPINTVMPVGSPVAV